MADAPRTRRIRALVGPPARPLCFGTVPDLGVLADDHFRLDAEASDAILAARVVHLAHHLTPDGGTDCRARLRREEARAWVAEHQSREALGVSSSLLPAHVDPTEGAVSAWLLAEADPVARHLAASHARRCGVSYAPDVARGETR